jgi:FkbM family methyltransferase
VRSAVRRRTFLAAVGRFPLRTSETPLLHVGTGYGGWLIPDVVDETWTCYCVGMGGDLSLEEYLLGRGALVRSVDPVEHFVDEGVQAFRGQGRFSAHHAAIAKADGTIEMQPHHEAASGSLSGANLYDRTDKPLTTVRAITLPSLLGETADDRIDLLKLDIEGLEYEVVPTIDFQALGIRVFSVQLHHNGSIRDARRLVKLVEAQGLRYVAQRRAAKLTFLR